MIHYKNDSNSAVIILHEIYGINSHIEDTCKKYYEFGFDVFCPKLFDENIVYDYKKEQEAYEFFYNTIGFDNSVLKVKNILIDLRKKYKFIYLVGYSVGATIAWLNSENYCDGCICYYGTKIRDYIDIEPKQPMLLLYLDDEKIPDMKNYIEKIDKYQNVDINLFQGKRGFADRYSCNYDHKNALMAWEKTLKFIKLNTENGYYKKK